MALLVLDRFNPKEVDPRALEADQTAPHAHHTAANALTRALVGEWHALDNGGSDLAIHHSVHLEHPHRRGAPTGHMDTLSLLLMAAIRREGR